MTVKKLIIALLTVSTTVFAAPQTGTTNSSSSSLKDFWKALQDSPLSLTLLSSNASKRKNTDHVSTSYVNGFESSNIAYLGYKFNSNNSLNLETRFTSVALNNANEEDSYTRYTRAVLKYQRSNILTEDRNGVSLAATVEKRYYPDTNIRNEANQYGLNRFGLVWGRSLGNFNLGATTYYAITDRIKKDEQSTTKNYLYFILTQGYTINDRWSVSATQELYHANRVGFTPAGAGDSVDIQFDLSYNITPRICVATNIGWDGILRGFDGRTIAKGMETKTDYGLDLIISAF